MIKTTLFVIIVIGFLASSVLAIQPYPGEWKLNGTGNWQNGDALLDANFFVSDNGESLNIKSLGINVELIITPIRSCIYKFPLKDIDEEIIEGNFSVIVYTIPPVLDFAKIDGISDSKTTAHGTWWFKDVTNDCGFSVDIDGTLQTFEVKGTWTASYIGTETLVLSKGKLATTWGKIKGNRGL